MGELRCEELAVRLGISPRAVFTLLDEDLERGVVERDGRGRWRLTRFAEARYGRALRDLSPPEQPAVYGRAAYPGVARGNRAFAKRSPRVRLARRRRVAADA
jgi:hypothetical protein